MKGDFLASAAPVHPAAAPAKPRHIHPATAGKQPRPRTGRSPVKFFLSVLLCAVTFGASFLYGRISHSQTGTFGIAALDNNKLIGAVFHLVASPDRKLAGETDGRINILLLGMGGEGHEGPNLTDTVLVASIKPEEGKVAMLSIPRDLLVPLPDRGWRKLNSANAFGELEQPGRGADYAREVLEGLLGIDIPYYIRVDFAGFKTLIDSVGGIDVDVETAFADYTYPTEDFGVQTVRFKEGPQHMDGETALKFTRSRHGTNGEGSDFARGARQQKVIAALKDKLLTASTFKNPTTVTNTLAALQANIRTNLQIGEILRLARVAQRVTPADISRTILDNGPDSPLKDSVVGGAYVLVPKNDDWSGLRDVAANLFENGTVDLAAAPPAQQASVQTDAQKPVPAPAPTKPPEKPRVEIQNGSGRAGQARTFATSLSGAGFQVVKIGNAATFDYTDSVIYDLTGGKRGSDLDKLKSTTKASQTKSGPPDGVDETALSGVDFVFIIGQNAL